MAKYTSKSVKVAKPAQFIADRFADLTTFGHALDNMPETERQRVGEVTFEKDEIRIDTKQVGTISFKVIEHNPQRVVMEAVGSPVPLQLVVDIKAMGDDACELTTSIDVEIPAMLRPLIGGAMQKAVDQFGDLMAKLNA